MVWQLDCGHRADLLGQPPLWPVISLDTCAEQLYCWVRAGFGCCGRGAGGMAQFPARPVPPRGFMVYAGQTSTVDHAAAAPGRRQLRRRL